MKIIVASDQAGFPLKESVLAHLAACGIAAADGGPASDGSIVDYPDFAELVGRAVNAGQYDRGVLICGTGLGMSIAANRLRGIRAAVCHDEFTAHMARAHNNSNVLCMGAWVVTPQRADGIVDEWLKTEYEHGRHIPRLVKLERLSQEGESDPLPASNRADHPFRCTVSLSPCRSTFGPLLFAGRLAEGLHAAAAAGFDAVELSLRTTRDIDLPHTRDLLRDLHLHISAIATGQSYLHDSLSLSSLDPQIRSACVDRLNSLVPLAAEFGAVLILGGIRGRFVGEPDAWPAQRADAIESIRRVVRCAAFDGAEVVIEPINRYETNFINTAGEGLELLDAVGEPAAKLLLDTFHMNIEEADISETLRQTAGRLGYLHLADSNRQAPGSGHIQFSDILHALDEIGYCGYVGAEILPQPDDLTAMTKAGCFLRMWTTMS